MRAWAAAACSAVAVLLLLLRCHCAQAWMQPRLQPRPLAGSRTLLAARRAKNGGRAKIVEPLKNLEKLCVADDALARLVEAVAPVEESFRHQPPRSFALPATGHNRNGNGGRGQFPAAGQAQFDPYKAADVHRIVDPLLTAQRKQLPAFKHQAELVDTIRANPVTIVVGATGSGKSTQVPQYLLEAHATQGAEARRCKIVCTQPRRIAASSLAERVAAERGEELGRSVGYMMSHHRKVSADTDLVYMTQGVLIRMVEDNPTLEGIDYVILDEVHERSLETDFLLPILRNVVRTRADFRLVIMSATMQAEEFIEYFGPSPVVSIEGRTFNVTEYLFEDVLELIDVGEPMSNIPPTRKINSLSPTEMVRLEANANYLANHLPYTIMLRLIEHIHEHEDDGAILVFLPGIVEMRMMHDVLQSSTFISQFKLHILHSSFPLEEQMLAHQPPPPGQRKVILSTNIAESSITVNDVVFVVDSGKRKEAGIDEKTKARSLNMEWVSRASASQRAGRAGRVRPGKCWHMIPSSVWEQLPRYDAPAISRTPLESVCLQVQALRVAPSRINGTASFLATLMNPPKPDVVAHAVQYLKEVGAFTEHEGLTELGKCMGELPLDPSHARVVLYGLLFKCLDPIVTLVAFMRDHPPFVVPVTARDASLGAQRLLAEEEASDHFAMWAAYLQYKQAVKEHSALEFCWQYFVAPSRMRIGPVKAQIVRALVENGLISRDSNLTAENENSHRWPIVKAALLAGLYPAVAESRHHHVRSTFFNRGVVVSSTRQSDWRHRWVVFSRHEVRDGIHMVFGVSTVATLPVLLLGGVGASAPALKTWPAPRQTKEGNDTTVVGLNDLIRVRTDDRVKRVLERVRQALFQCFQLVVNRDRRIDDQPIRQFVETVCAAIEEADASRSSKLSAPEQATAAVVDMSAPRRPVPTEAILATRTAKLSMASGARLRRKRKRRSDGPA